MLNRSEIIRRIRKRYQRRDALNLSAVKREEPELVDAVYLVQPYLGWKGALEEAGISYEKIRVYIRETVECQLCGKRFQLLIGHLMQVHLITPQDYREQYPGAELASEQFRAAKTGRVYVESHPEFIKHWEPIYTREYVLDRLNEYARRGFCMDSDTMYRIDCALVAAVRNYVKTDWDDGLRLIGVDPVEHRALVRDDDYTLEDFRQWLNSREQQGLDCTFGVLMQERDESRRALRMLTWAKRQYGNWRAALLAAGVDLSKPIFGEHRFLSPQDVKAEIKRLKDAGNNLTHRAVCLLPQGTQLTSAGVRFFGTWEAALDSARVPARLRGRRVNYETADDIRQAIATRIENQYGLSPIDLYYGSRADVPLWKKSFEHFESWQNAVAQAGGSAAHRREAAQSPFSSRAKVTAELKRRAHAGQLLARRVMTYNDQDKSLYVMAIGFFGSWQAAVRSAGVDPKTYHEWNLKPKRKYAEKEDILAEIRQRQLRGQPLNARSLTNGEHRDAPLWYTARKLFGGFKQAIQAAGIDYQQVVRKQQDYDAMKNRTYRTYSTRKEVIEEIQRRIRESLPVTYRALAHGDQGIRDIALLNTGKSFFADDWDRALQAAGVDLKAIQPEWVRQRKRNLKLKNNNK